MADEHSTDKAELGARDRAQPTRIDQHVNLRADEDVPPPDEQRAALVEEVEEERGPSSEELAPE